MLLFSCGLVGLCVGHGDERLVVEHLFKVRDKPLCIGGVPMKSESDMVVYAAPAHGLQSLLHHLQGELLAASLPVAQQEEQIMGCGKLGGSAEAAVLGVIAECRAS